MSVKPGEVWFVDLGLKGKFRPFLVVSRSDPEAPRALVSAVPITRQNRGSRYEVPLPKVPWLDAASVANVQGIQTFETVELSHTRGAYVAQTLATVRAALAYWLDCRGSDTPTDRG